MTRKSLLAASLNALVLTALTTALLAGCGPSKTVELAQPAIPVEPAKPQPKPTPSQDPNDPDNGNAGNNPDRPEKPEPPPENPGRRNYRVVCQFESLRAFTTLRSTARALDGAVSLFLSETGGEPTRDGANVYMPRKVMMVPKSQRDHASLFFVARKETNYQLGSEHFYYSNVDLLLRLGRVENMGSIPSVSSSAGAAANAVGMESVNYGASDEGNFILLPAGSGLRVYNRDRTKTLGTISISTQNALYPRILEKEKLFTAIVYEGGRFRQVVKQLSISNSAVSVTSTLDLGSGSRSASPISRFGPDTLAWSEGGKADSVITIAKLNLVTGKVTRAGYVSSVNGSVVFPVAGLYDVNGTPTVAVAVEKTETRGTFPNARGSVDYAKLQTLTFAGDKLVESEAIDYPAVVVKSVQDNGRRGRFVMNAMLSTVNGDELLMTLEARYGSQIFKERGGLINEVGEDDCAYPAITEEAL